MPRNVPPPKNLGIAPTRSAICDFSAHCAMPQAKCLASICTARVPISSINSDRYSNGTPGSARCEAGCGLWPIG